MGLILIKLSTNRKSNPIINNLLIRDNYIDWKNNKFKEKLNNFNRNNDSLLLIVEHLILILFEDRLFN